MASTIEEEKVAQDRWFREHFGIPPQVSVHAGLTSLQQVLDLEHLLSPQRKEVLVVQRHVDTNLFLEFPCVSVASVSSAKRDAAWYCDAGLDETQPDVLLSEAYVNCRWEVFRLVHNYANNKHVKQFKVGITWARKASPFDGLKKRFAQRDYAEYEMCIGIVIGHRSVVVSLEDWLHTHVSLHPKYAAFRGQGGWSSEPLAFLYVALSLGPEIPQQFCSTIELRFPGSSKDLSLRGMIRYSMLSRISELMLTYNALRVWSFENGAWEELIGDKLQWEVHRFRVLYLAQKDEIFELQKEPELNPAHGLPDKTLLN